jgi:hypothetical protein
MDPVLLRQRLETARRTVDTLERQLADPAVASDPARLQAIARERSRLEPLVHDFDQFQRLELEREATRRLLKDQRLEPDVRDSLNQFANILRESLSVIGEAPGNLIDSYIDSIIQLKNQTRLELEKPPLSERPVQETDELGLMVAQVLQRACERKLGKYPDPSCVGQADRLLQAVMNEDLSAWMKEGSTPIEFNRAAFARDQLLRSVESDLPDVERKLAAFCDQIVDSGGVGGPVRSYS